MSDSREDIGVTPPTFWSVIGAPCLSFLRPQEAGLRREASRLDARALFHGYELCAKVCQEYREIGEIRIVVTVNIARAIAGAAEVRQQ